MHGAGLQNLAKAWCSACGMCLPSTVLLLVTAAAAAAAAAAGLWQHALRGLAGP
jgi:hypothetical protein